MKNIKTFFKSRLSLGLLGSFVLVMSCTSDFDKVNTDKNTIKTITSAEIPFLFTRALAVGSTNQANYQVAQNLFADQYAQYFACTATYFGSDRLVINQNWVGANFNPIYVDVVPQLKKIFEMTDPNSAEYALASIWWVYSFHKVTDYWGPIPYFNIAVTEKDAEYDYDPQDKIYDDFFKRLDAAAKILAGKTKETPYASYDILYGGDVNKWIKFTNTLRLRLALRISKVDPARAKTEAEAAVAGGVMAASPDDDALVQRSTRGDDGNGLAIMQWGEFRMSSAMESVLKGYNDPRMPVYYLPVKDSIPVTYDGTRNGLTTDQMTDKSEVNLAKHLSQQGPRWSPTTEGGINDYLSTPQNVVCTAEAYFLRAEGVMNGWNMGGGTAQQYYEAGIRNSWAQWGITEDPSGYIANTVNKPIKPLDFMDSDPMTNIPVGWGVTEAVQREQIATQKWLALYPDGIEAWADYRRNPIVKLYPVVKSDNPLITNTATQRLRRIPFLTSEKQVNPKGVAQAQTLLGGEDNTQTPLWWDKNP
jgi:hypothetical protein